MILSKVGTWFWNVIWPPTVHDAVEIEANKKGIKLSLSTQSPQTDIQSYDIQSTQRPEKSHRSQSSPLSHDPYFHLPIIGSGMTGFIHEMGKDRVVKKAKHYDPPHAGKEKTRQELMNEMNQQILENEIQIFRRLGNHKGIIRCFKTSQHGIELARAQDDLEIYLEKTSEPENLLKIKWIFSLIETLSYIHSRKVFVDDMALRNILILDEQVQFADFGQSILFPLDIDITSANNEGLTTRVEILHLGWILYSIATWKVHKYYYFDDDLDWPELDSFPNVDNVLCGRIIAKCWRGEYTSMDHVKNEACQLLMQTGG